MFQRVLERLAQALNAHDIPYMVIGGQAVLLYGEPRLTKDVDVTLGRSTDHLQEILALVKGLRWKVLVNDPKEFAGRTMVLPCEDTKSGIRVDFIFSSSSYEQQALQRVRRQRVGQAEVCFASPEDVIIHKVIAGRPRDLEDVKNLLVKNPQIDKHYVENWLRQFEQSLSQPFVDRWRALL